MSESAFGVERGRVTLWLSTPNRAASLVVVRLDGVGIPKGTHTSPDHSLSKSSLGDRGEYSDGGQGVAAAPREEHSGTRTWRACIGAAAGAARIDECTDQGGQADEYGNRPWEGKMTLGGNVSRNLYKYVPVVD